VVRPLDAQASEWNCTLENCPDSAGGFAVRLGLRYVKGMGEGDWKLIIQARRVAPFSSLDDFVRRTKLNEDTLGMLAEAGAFDSLAIERRDALWELSRLVRARSEPLPFIAREHSPEFNSLTNFEEVSWDYRMTALSPRRHPLEPLRPTLVAQALPDARTVAHMPNGVRVNYAGLVICRQRPGTAGGVVFMTLEDETGFVNVVVWESVFQRYALLAKTASFLGVTGTLQVEDKVVHLVAEQLWKPILSLKPSAPPSRDFH
jgi:error-prone DNA polymerase